MNNKGFTVVELIAAFSITMVISLFLFELLIEVKDIFVETSVKTVLQEKTGIVTKNIKHLLLESGNTATCEGNTCIINGQKVSIFHTDDKSVPDYVIIKNQKHEMPKDGDKYIKIKNADLSKDTTDQEGLITIKFDLVSASLSKPYKYDVTFYCNGRINDSDERIPYTGAIYRWSTAFLANKGSADASSYPYTITNLTKGTDFITEADYPTASARATALNHNNYLKHDIVNDEIINSYVCFISDTEHCMKGADTSAFAANTQIIHDYQTYYSLGDYDSSTDAGCRYTSSYSQCFGGGFPEMRAVSSGLAVVSHTSNSSCQVTATGDSECTGS